MYTTISRVRTLSWFDNTTNITDELIKSKIIIAWWYINSAIWYVYSLPIAYHYDNTLAFTWPATSWGTLAIVINWTTYNVTVVSWDTASVIADKFRIVCESSVDFITDDLWLWDTVLIISNTTSANKSTAYAEVNITSAPDSFWLTTTIRWRQKRFPIIIEQITAEIATSLLFIDVYGVESQDTWKDWPTRMEIINETLQKLQWVHESWQSIRVFDEITNAEIGVSSQLEVVSYPNDTSDTDTTDPTSPKMFINKVF